VGFVKFLRWQNVGYKTGSTLQLQNQFLDMKHQYQEQGKGKTDDNISFLFLVF